MIDNEKSEQERNNNGCPHKALILHAFTVSIFPSSHEYLEKFSACLLDDPKISLNHCPVLAGQQGIGKGLYTFMLMKLLGEKNCHRTGAERIAGRWWGQELLNKILIVVNEFDFEHGVYEKPQYGGQAHQTPNFIFTTNYTNKAHNYIGERHLRWVTTRETALKELSIFNKLATLINDQEAINGYRYYLQNNHLGLNDTTSVADCTLILNKEPYLEKSIAEYESQFGNLIK